MTDIPPFFIVGSGRSGTTLLRLILSGHSRLHIPPETWYVMPLAEQLPLTGMLTPQQVAQAAEIMTSSRRWVDLGIDAAEFRAQAAALPQPALTDLLNLVYGHHLRLAGKPRFGDKTPVYIGILPQLDALYPSARYIHLIRDGRDVAISFTDVQWGFSFSREFEWPTAMRLARQYRASALAPRILEVRYEDLVRDTEGTVRRICDFLGEAFEPAMLDWQRQIDMVPAQERHIHRKLERPISQDAIGVWQRKLSALECFVIEASLQRDLRRQGYALRFAHPLWRPLLAATGAVLHALSPLLDRAVPFLQHRGLLPKTLYL